MAVEVEGRCLVLPASGPCGMWGPPRTTEELELGRRIQDPTRQRGARSCVLFHPETVVWGEECMWHPTCNKQMAAWHGDVPGSSGGVVAQSLSQPVAGMH
jgi:hypothetical protein